VKHESDRVSDLLLEKGAKFYLVNNDGDKPLHLASKNELPVIADLLLQNGAYANALGGHDKNDLAIELVFNNTELTDAKKEQLSKILFQYGAKIPPELLKEISEAKHVSDDIKELVKNLSQPESIRQRDEDLLNDEALIKVYKNLILNGKLTLDPEKSDDDIIYKVIVKAIETITKKESAEIEKTNPEKLREIQKFISQAKDPKSGEKRSADFSALRGKEMGSQELSAGESSKRLKTEEAGAKSGGEEDLTPSTSTSGQKRRRDQEEPVATQLAVGDPTKRSKADGGAGGGAGRGAAGGSRG
jgi:hypothetical protein